jgi:hypothetical protein
MVWRFTKKQPALTDVGLWFFLIPGALINMLSTVMEWNVEIGLMGFTEAQQNMLTVIIIAAIILLAVIMLWGGACVLLIGKKLVHSPAGRNRTSLAAIAREGRAFIVPLLLTQLLRFCFTLLWSLLLIIPGIIYSLRTFFYDIVVVVEGIAYREGLHRSKEVVRGHLWAMLWRTAVVFIVIFGPPQLFSFLGYRAVHGMHISATVIMDLIDALLNAPAMIITLLTTVALYDELKRKNA